MSDKVQFTFQLSNLVDRIAGNTEMTGRGKKKRGNSKLGEDASLSATKVAAAATTRATVGKPTSSRQIMEAFLQDSAMSTPTKRSRDEEEMEQEGEDNTSKRPLPVD